MNDNCKGCFADNNRFSDGCTALRERIEQNCPFYKERAKYIEDQEFYKNKLCENSSHIYDKYYGKERKNAYR